MGEKFTGRPWIFGAALALGFGLFRLIYAGLVPLSPQEAYYWVWSLHPELSYFEHPPLVAYAIRLSTQLLGAGEYAVRLPAILCGTGTTWIVFVLADKFFGPRAGLTSALLLNLALGFAPWFLFMTPEAPLLFFWSLTLLFFWKAAGERRKNYWVWAGLSLGLAFLSKYTAVFLALAVVVWLTRTKDLRRVWKGPGPYVAFLLALIVFSPVLVWNHQNGWASFLFQTRDRLQAASWVSPENLLTFFLSQAGVMTPLLFIGLGSALLWGLSRWRGPMDKGESLLVVSAALPLLFFTLAATRVWVKINWPVAGYLSLVILLAGYYARGTWPGRWVRRYYVPCLWGLAGVVFAAAHLVLPLRFIPLSEKIDTLTGWPEAAQYIHNLRQDLSSQGPTFIWSWDHKTAAEIQFYLPKAERVYARTLVGAGSFAHDFWDPPKDLKGKNALLVWSSLDPFTVSGLAKTEKAFGSVISLPHLDVFRGGQKIRSFFFFHCLDYQPDRVGKAETGRKN